MRSVLYSKIRSSLTVITFLMLISCSEPDYKLAGGGSGNLDSFLGKWLVINYWADWCPPCIKEMPELESFYIENKEDVLVLAYNFDRLEDEELEEQIKRFAVNVPSILTCLLYTSPSPRDRQKSRMPSSA